MIELRVELRGESDDLVLDDAFAPRPINLPDGIIFQILRCHLFTVSRVNHEPPATAAALIRPNVATATDSAMKTSERLPVKRTAIQPPSEPLSRRARLASNHPNKH